MRSLPLILTGLVTLAGASSATAQRRGLDERTIEQIRKIVRQEVRAAVRDALREMHGGKAAAHAEKRAHAEAKKQAEAKVFGFGARSKEMSEKVRKAIEKARKAAGEARVFLAEPLERTLLETKTAKKKKKGARVLEMDHDGKHIRIEVEGLEGGHDTALKKAMMWMGKVKDGEGHAKPRLFVLGPKGHGKVETKTFSFPGGKAKVLLRRLDVDDDEGCEECEDCECDDDECECEEHEEEEIEEIEEILEHPGKAPEHRKPIRVRVLRRRIHV